MKILYITNQNITYVFKTLYREKFIPFNVFKHWKETKELKTTNFKRKEPSKTEENH